jgi:peptide/nickel transport system permease protein
MTLAAQRLRYCALRLLQAVPTVLVIVSLNFLLLHLAPGDAAQVLAGESGSATPEYVARLRQAFGLDQPLYLQFLLYLKNVLTLDLGYSFRNGMPVLDLILQRLGPTLLLMVCTLVISIGLGIALGLLAGVKPNSWIDNLISIFSLLSYATPLFWIGLMLILVFALNLGWFPTSGMETIGAFHEGWDRVWDVAGHLVLPTMTLSMFYLALYVRLMRSATLEQMGFDYVTTARAKGLSERQVVFGHVLRNAAMPILTMAGVQLGNLLGGSVIVESVFGWPGLGMLAFNSLFARDLNLLLGIFFVSACLVIFVNILVDTIYTFLDPRIELR